MHFCVQKTKSCVISKQICATLHLYGCTYWKLCGRISKCHKIYTGVFSDKIEQNPFELQAFCDFFKNQKFLFTLCHPIVHKLSYIPYQLHSIFPNNSKVDVEMLEPIYTFIWNYTILRKHCSWWFLHLEDYLLELN